MNTLLKDGKYHRIEVSYTDNRYGVLTIDGKSIHDDATRRLVLGDAVVDAEMLPKRLWEDK